MRTSSTPQVAQFGIGNNMAPDEVPEELRNLTMLEEQLSTSVHPIAKVYSKKGGQYGYSGQRDQHRP